MTGTDGRRATETDFSKSLVSSSDYPARTANNENKKAIVLDPRGGPFKDIVKAAIKCSGRIIHTGKPLNPKEKDLAKWIKKAAPFQ